jgi:hypothetical protein
MTTITTTAIIRLMSPAIGAPVRPRVEMTPADRAVTLEAE